MRYFAAGVAVRLNIFKGSKKKGLPVNVCNAARRKAEREERKLSLSVY